MFHAKCLWLYRKSLSSIRGFKLNDEPDGEMSFIQYSRACPQESTEWASTFQGPARVKLFALFLVFAFYLEGIIVFVSKKAF
jgi:hypothetical protein